MKAEVYLLFSSPADRHRLGGDFGAISLYEILTAGHSASLWEKQRI
ncbi:MAG TPA: hypothetical protein VFB22_01810 [Candidatus Baltobacteraceae bacterium]|nr:hypothetical protein [Candidatus Baltobacteraceae bacterium]